jgi:SAM-dependent methyltransferase
MSHAENVARWIGAGKIGAEIVFTAAEPSAVSAATPLPGISPPPIVIACPRNPGSPLPRRESTPDPHRLPFRNSCLDYVAADGVLHRLANPVAALAEWYRVLRPGGLLCLVVPDRRHTADHTRAPASVSDLLHDYVAGRTNCDAGHIDDFVYEMDWSRHAPELAETDLPGEKAALARRLHEAVERKLEIDIPFHPFELSNLCELVAALRFWAPCPFDWEIVDAAEPFPADDPVNVALCIRAHKGWLARAEAAAFDALFSSDRAAAVLRPEPVPFEDLIQATHGAAPPSAPPRLFSEYLAPSRPAEKPTGPA